MSQSNQKIHPPAVEWVKEKDGKYIVKFSGISVPVEMSESYFNKNISGPID